MRIEYEAKDMFRSSFIEENLVQGRLVERTETRLYTSTGPRTMEIDEN